MARKPTPAAPPAPDTLTAAPDPELAEAVAQVQKNKERQRRAEAFRADLDALCKKYACTLSPRVVFANGQAQQAAVDVIVMDPPDPAV